jgi:hypothetical protein
MDSGLKSHMAALPEYAIVSQNREQTGESPEDRTVRHSRNAGNEPGIIVRNGITGNSQKLCRGGMYHGF